MRHKLCCIGFISADKVVTPQKTVCMPGGTSYYVSHAINNFDDIDYALITAVGDSERHVPEGMKAQGMNVTVLPSRHSVVFENIYGNNPDERKQRVLAKADPFTLDQLKDAEGEIFHLGALLTDDFSRDIIKYLSSKGKVSVDAQGYLREVRDTHVYPADWSDKLESLRYVHILKVDKHEAEVLTGYKDVSTAALQLCEWGVKEVLLTFGSMGSLIYDGEKFYSIPAYPPRKIVDATGCGDTYVAGYLYKRVQDAPVEEAACFAAALATLKIENFGPVKTCMNDVMQVIEQNRGFCAR